MASIASTCRNLAIGIDVVIFGADAHVAGGQNQVRLVYRRHHIHQAKVVRLKLQRINVNHDLAVSTAKGLRHGCAGHAGNLISYLELRQILQIASH